MFRPLPEPDPPDFDRLPPGTKEHFDRRLDRLPIRHVHTGIGSEAIMSNESQVLHRDERAHGFTWDEFAALGTWHMRAVHDRISAQRPDLLAPRRPSGFYSQSRPMTRKDRLMVVLVLWHLWNFLSGSHCWIRNRCVEVRVMMLRASGHG